MDKQKQMKVILWLLIFTFIGVVVFGYGKLSALNVEAARNDSAVATLEREIEGLKKPEETEPEITLGEEEQAVITHSASELGMKVAEYQNVYWNLNASENREAFDVNVAALDACFMETDKTARVPWYSGSLPGVWSFVTNGSFTGDTLGVLWVCKNPDTQDLVAYATATYDSTANAFFDVSYNMSYLGSASVESSGDPGESQTPGIDTGAVNDMVNAIKDSDVETAPEELSEEDFEEGRAGQSALRDLMRQEMEDAENEN